MKLRRFTGLAALALLIAALAGEPAAAADTTAVVLVSGFTTTTPYTAPGQLCTGSQPYGPTWTYIAQQLQQQGSAVFTAPVNDGPGPPAADPPNFSDCPATPSGTTINSRGDIYDNATALANFVAYLKQAFGVTAVHLVGHSYGGLWVRGAMRLQSGSFPDVSVLSVTTMGTPHLGDFLADIAEGIDPALCGTNLICKLVADILIDEREAKFEPALSQITQSFVSQWNQGQGSSLSGIPLSAVSGDAITFSGQSNPYVSPNDGIVGIASAQAAGLDQAGVIPSLSCFSPFPDVHSVKELPLFPAVKYALPNDPATLAAIELNLSGQPAPSSCPTSNSWSSARATAVAATRNGSDFAESAARTRTVVMRSALRPLSARRLRAPQRSDVLVLVRRSRVRCKGRLLRALPLHGSQRVSLLLGPRCGTPLTIDPGAGRVLHVRPVKVRAAVTQAGRRLQVRTRPRARGTLSAYLQAGRRKVRLRLNRQGWTRARIAGTVRLHLVLRRPGRPPAAGAVVLELP